MKKETDKFRIEYKFSLKYNKKVIFLQSKTNEKRLAVHSMFNLLSDNSNVIASKSISDKVAKFIINNFEIRGDTESFNIYKTDLISGYLQNKIKCKIPSQIRHQYTKAESSFTSDGEKLYYHWPIFKKFRDSNYCSIIRATMTNTQLCSSHCQYCSTIARNKEDSVSLDEAKDFVRSLYFEQAEYNKKHFLEYNNLYKKITGSDIKLRGLILSGGGQPNLWEHFETFVEWLSHLKIDLGLITNGFPKGINEDIYKYFKWIRISITPPDASPHYLNGHFEKQYLPKTIINNPSIVVGWSYVYGPWTTDKILRDITKSIEEYGFDYCRLLTDCNLSRNGQFSFHYSLSERLYKLGFIDKEGNPIGKIFHQLKYHGNKKECKELWNEGRCYLQVYNIFWDTTGHDEQGFSYCYPCDSVTVLTEENDKRIQGPERKFNAFKWGTVKNTEVEKIFKEPYKSFFDPREICTSCLFMRNNRIVKELINTHDYLKIKPFKDIEHINFP